MRVLAMKLQSSFGKIACVLLLLLCVALTAPSAHAAKTAAVPHRVLKTSGDISDFAFSRDGKTLVTLTDGWEGVADSESVQDNDKSTITIWNTATWKVKRRILVHLRVTELAISPDGKTLATLDFKSAAYHNFFDSAVGRFVWQRSSLRIWNIASGHLIHTFALNDVGSDALCFSTDGQVLAVSDRDKRVQNKHYVQLYDALTWKPYRRLQGAKDAIVSIAISPDKRWIAASSFTSTGEMTGVESLHIWNAHTGRRVRHIHSTEKDYNDDGYLKSAALKKLPLGNPTFLPDSKSLIAGNVIYGFVSPSYVQPVLHGVKIQETNDDVAISTGRTIKIAVVSYKPIFVVLQVWRLKPQKLIFKMRYKTLVGYSAVHLSPDGHLLAMATEKQLNIWRIP